VTVTVTVTPPKPMTSGAGSDGRFGKQDFVYLPTEDVYRCLGVAPYGKCSPLL
jgi:transposase